MVPLSRIAGEGPERSEWDEGRDQIEAPAMNIKDVIPVEGRSGFFNRDLGRDQGRAPRPTASPIPGRPVSPGFTKIVQPGTAISVMLLLDDGQVAFGDCVDVILTGVAGRDLLFQAEQHLEFLRATMRESVGGPADRPLSRVRRGGRPFGP